jgi:hypothetical protein
MREFFFFLTYGKHNANYRYFSPFVYPSIKIKASIPMRKLILFGLSLLVASTTVWAQSRPGSVKGNVSERKSGDGIPNAIVKIMDGKAVEAQGKTDFDGNFSISPVDEGSYTIRIEAFGMQPYELGGAKVPSGRPLVLTVKMTEKTNELDVVTVKAKYEAPLVETGKTAQTFDQEVIRNLPQRGLTGLLQMSASVVTNEATDGVTIGFARVPFGRTYTSFSTTSTDDRYCAISVITNAASTDEYELVGRFNATLSATASFNWSIPAADIVISRPVYETRWLTSTIAMNNVTLGNGTLAQRYQIKGNVLKQSFKFTFGSTSSISGSIAVVPAIAGSSSMPISATVGGAYIEDLVTTGFEATLRYATTTSVSVITGNTASSYLTSTGTTSTAPMTWATGDFVAGYFEIEI